MSIDRRSEMIVSREPGASRWGRLWRLLTGETQPVSDSTVPMPRADAGTEPGLALIDSMIAGFPNPTIVIDADLRRRVSIAAM
jgi:hypothetical protein